MLSTFGRSSCYSRPQFALLSAASSATRGRESMSCKVSWGNRYMKVRKDSSLSCHSTKATLYKIDRLEKDDNINRGAQGIADTEHL